MTLTAEKAYQHVGETKVCANYVHDLFHELSTKLDALWHYDQYIANATIAPMDFEGSYIKTPYYDAYLEEASFCEHVKAFWQDCKRQCQADIRRLKQVIAEEVQKAACSGQAGQQENQPVSRQGEQP